jgi:hypothetical protein
MASAIHGCHSAFPKHINQRTKDGALRMKFIAIAILIGISTARGMDPEKAAQAIVGEAAGEDFKSKLAIAGALRNRGTLDGVRGAKNMRMIMAQPAWVLRDARAAWAQSATNDISRGGRFWESANFKRPAWSIGMTETAHVGKFIFYKPEAK